jgi:hypothetical protein
MGREMQKYFLGWRDSEKKEQEWCTQLFEKEIINERC